jgi:hypothetical protein
MKGAYLKTWAKRLLTSPTLIVAIAVGALILAHALEANLSRLHAPGDNGVAYSALHYSAELQGGHDTWTAGKETLQAFGAKHVETLIRTHIAADSVFVAFTYLFSRSLKRNPRRFWQTSLHVALAVDLAGNAIELLNTWVWQNWLATLAGVLWRLALFAYILTGASLLWRHARPIGKQMHQSPATIRVLLLADVLLFALIFFNRIGVQSDDLVERWFDGGFGPMLWPLVFFAIYVLLVRLTRRLSLQDDATMSPRVAVGGTFLLIAVGTVLRYSIGWGSGMLVLGLGALVIMLGSQGDEGGALPNTQIGQLKDVDVPWMRGAVASLPALAIAIVLLRSGANAFSVTEREISYWWLFGSGLGAVGVYAVAYSVASAPSKPITSATGKRWMQRLLFAMSVVMIGAVLIVGDSARGSRSVGTFGLLFLGLAAASVIGATVRSLLSPTNTPLAFRRLNFSRTPVMLLMVAWIAVTSFLNGLTNTSTRPIRYYDAHLIQRTANVEAEPNPSCVPNPDPVVISEILWTRFCAWVAVATPPPKVGAPIPMILVTASGGGVRAAAWTTTVLDCVLFRSDITGCVGDTNDDHFGSLFAANGASGGSVGIATAVAHRLSVASGTAVQANWIDSALGGDALAPTVGRAIGYDALLGMFGINPGHDRTWALESAWAQPWQTTANYCPAAKETPIDEIGFVGLSSMCRVPLMMFNGIDVSSGCRVNVTPIDIDASLASDDNSTIDLVDNLDPHRDVPLFSAAFLSARFPLVSSAGRIDGTVVSGGQILNIVDGGYGENSGTAQVAELWHQLGPLVTAYNAEHTRHPVLPVLVQINNGEGNPSELLEDIVEDPVAPPGCPTTPSTLGELFRPVEAIAAVNKTRDAQLQRQLAGAVRRFDTNGMPGVVVTLTMFEHPGRTMPLGWTLSRNTVDDLRDQLTMSQNLEALQTVETAIGGL